jgi:tetratricopeptide (TPR) repeat protein
MTALTVAAYETELEKIEQDIVALGARSLEPPINVENATKYAYRLYQRASLNGDLKQLRVAEEAIDAVIPQLQRPDDLLLLKAGLCFKVHRLDGVKEIFAAYPELREADEGMKLDADLHFQEGRYDTARDAYLHAISKNRSWDNLARYAHFVSKFEGADVADELYAEAEDELTSKQMRSFAWVQLQRGLLDLERGRFDEAEAHYSIADQAYPGYWMVEEHQAALLAQRGRHEAALDLYRSLTERVRKPELLQTVGDLYRHIGAPELARPYHDRALEAFEESAARGEVHYYHHLVDFHCAVTRSAKQAVEWARKDVALRSNFSTQSALAWALHLDGSSNEALAWMEEALASRVIDGHLFSHAAAIYAAAGQHDRSHHYKHEAGKLNTRAGGFHTHHH